MDSEAPSAIEKYNKIVQKQSLYQFITALDDKYEAVKKEIVRRDPLLTVRVAHGIVRRESNNDQILGTGGSLAKEAGHGIGSGLSAIEHSRSSQPPNAANRPWNRRQEEDKSKLTCSHCGGRKHTKEGCFLLVGYPDWWDDMKKARAARSATRKNERVAIAVTDRIADTGKPAGNFSCEHGGVDRKSEETARASAARVWNEEGNGIFGSKYPNFHVFAKYTPKSPLTSLNAPASHKYQNPPINFAKSQNIPHICPCFPKQPHSSAKNTEKTLENPKLGFDPGIVCKNQFQAPALIGSSET